MNWTLEAILELIGSLPLFFSSFLLLKDYFKTKDFVMGFVTLAWFDFGLLLFLDAMSYVLVSEFLFRFKFLFFF